jgi:tryptophan synthase alpha chain
MSRLEPALQASRDAGRVAVFPYLTAGYPDDPDCERLLLAAAAAGADGLELGIPFSDPLADGVTLQRASQTALEGGATLERALALIGRLRARLDVPIVPMSYLNPLLAYGFDRFCADAAAAGADGLIVPDVPLEEAEAFRASCSARALDYVYMVAPTSTAARIRAIAANASGMVYCVSLRGVTGARASMNADIGGLLARVRQHTNVPLLVGFGVSRPEHVAALREAGADAVVVASALVDLVERTDPDRREGAVRQFVGDLVAAARGATPV